MRHATISKNDFQRSVTLSENEIETRQKFDAIVFTANFAASFSLSVSEQNEVDFEEDVVFFLVSSRLSCESSKIYCFTLKLVKIFVETRFNETQCRRGIENSRFCG